jgi:hypothetical protein
MQRTASKEGSNPMRSACFVALVAGLALLTPGAAHAQSGYLIQPIVKLGDQVGGVQIPATDGYFEVGTLNDNGGLVFITASAAGGDALVYYTDGKLTPLVAAGMSGPAGTWPAELVILPPVSMNQLGDIVFVAGVPDEQTDTFNTYLWESRSQKITAMVVRGAPALPNLAFAEGGGAVPTISNSNEIAIVGKVKDASGKVRDSVWLLGRDRRLLPVAVPGQQLPDGRLIEEACCTSINNAGVVAFLARRQGDPPNTWSAYMWEQGTITPVAVVGTPAGGATIGTVWAVSLNDRNPSATVELSVGSSEGLVGIYRFAGGKLTPLVVPGQAMPGGGTLKIEHGTSFPNVAGEFAFWATLDDNSTAAYLLAEDGGISLILKSGASTPFGRVTNVAQGAGLSHGIALNTRGQVAVTLRFEDVIDVLVLLTRVEP